MAAPVTASAATFDAGTPTSLFAAAISGGSPKQNYAVSRDGRFLINGPADASDTPPTTLILNWKPPAK